MFQWYGMRPVSSWWGWSLQAIFFENISMIWTMTVNWICIFTYFFTILRRCSGHDQVLSELHLTRSLVCLVQEQSSPPSAWNMYAFTQSSLPLRCLVSMQHLFSFAVLSSWSLSFSKGNTTHAPDLHHICLFHLWIMIILTPLHVIPTFMYSWCTMTHASMYYCGTHVTSSWTRVPFDIIPHSVQPSSLRSSFLPSPL